MAAKPKVSGSGVGKGRNLGNSLSLRQQDLDTEQRDIEKGKPAR